MKWLIAILVLAIVLIAGCTNSLNQVGMKPNTSQTQNQTPQAPEPILVLGSFSVPNGHKLSENYFTYKKSELYDSATGGYDSAQLSFNLNSSNTKVKDINFHFQCWKGSDLIINSDNGEFMDYLNANAVTYNLSNSGARILAISAFNRNTKSKGTVMNTGSSVGTKIVTLPINSSVDFRLQLAAADLTTAMEFTCKVDFTSSSPSYNLSTDNFTIFYMVG